MKRERWEEKKIDSETKTNTNIWLAVFKDRMSIDQSAMRAGNAGHGDNRYLYKTQYALFVENLFGNHRNHCIDRK